MAKTPVEKKIENLITPALADMGFEVVRVLLTTSSRPTLQIMAEKPDGTMGVDDCEDVSRTVSALLDVENPVPSAYTLEVSSPGLDRPLTRLKDFQNFVGHEARVEVDPPVDDRKRFKGILAGVEGENVLITVEEEQISLPFADIQKAKLLLTDELIKSSQQQKKA